MSLVLTMASCDLRVGARASTLPRSADIEVRNDVTLRVTAATSSTRRRSMRHRGAPPGRLIRHTHISDDDDFVLG